MGITTGLPPQKRLGVVPINLSGFSHFLLAAVLGHEFGIGVQNGCFCGHPYLLHLLGINPEEAEIIRTNMLAGDRSAMPGMVRISFGLYNTEEEVNALIDALKAISTGDFQGEYNQDMASGEFHPKGWAPDFNKFFALSSQ